MPLLFAQLWTLGMTLVPCSQFPWSFGHFTLWWANCTQGRTVSTAGTTWGDRKTLICVKKELNLRWMARRRGMGVGLLGGEELVLWRLRLLSMEGDACTVILCWKSRIRRTSITVIIIPAELQSDYSPTSTTMSERSLNLDVLVTRYSLKGLVEQATFII